MKIFSWMQNKLNGKKEAATEKQNNPAAYATNRHRGVWLQQDRREEFSDWPGGLLAIGTFGNNNLKEEDDDDNNNNNNNLHQENNQFPCQLDMTVEEVRELQNELRLLLHEQASGNYNLSAEDQLLLESYCRRRHHHLPLDESLESHYETNNACDQIIMEQLPNTSLASSLNNKGKDVCLDHSTSSSTIGKKSVSFLLNKILLCRSGFPSTPSLRDPSLQETRIDKSMMGKMLRAILHKKIYPQTSSSRATSIKYLENKQKLTNDSEQEEMPDDKANEGSKWVKTDSEFIVLEI